MGFRIAHIPLVAVEQILSVGGIDITLRAYQPVVWVRLVPWAGLSTPDAVPFPAVIDTGNNNSFLIPAPFFRAWSRTDPDLSFPGRPALVNGIPLRFHRYNLDLFRTRGGGPTDRVAARLQTDQGVMIIPDALVPSFPRLPVLGVRCLTTNRITFSLNGDKQTFSLSQSSVRPAPRGPA
jgi:hypothetical protein